MVFQEGRRFFWGMSEDIGGGGLFLATRCPPDPGEDLKIQLPGPGAEELMVLRGRVVHRREGSKEILPVEADPRPAGVGVAFEEVPPSVEERLRALLTEEGLRSAPGSGAEGEEAEAGDASLAIEDPAEIRRVFECLCEKILPVRMKRLGGRIHYTTYFRDVIGASAPFRVKAEAVGLEDFDSAFCEEVPFVFRFRLEDDSYCFAMTERPAAMAGPWSFDLPARLYRGQDRRIPRYSYAVKHPLTVEFPDPLDRGLKRVKNVLDVSFGGLAFKNYPGEEVYSQGQSLSDVKICNFDHVCWESHGVVRHVAFVCPPGGEVFQRVGVEFSEEDGSGLDELPCLKEGELEKIEGLSLIRRHLKRVAMTRVKILTGMDHSILFSDGRLCAEQNNGGLDLAVTAPLLADGVGGDFNEAKVTIHYLYHGTYHFFSTRTKRENGSLCLAVPTVINRARRRRVVRARPEGMVKTRFRFFHPVLGKRINLPVRDLSIRGLSFESDYVRDLIWKGIRLCCCEILLGEEYHPLGSVEVRSLVQQAAPGGEWDKYCGVEFIDLPAATERRISAFIFQRTNPKIQTPTAERIEGLWKLFERSGFIYPSKGAYIRKIKPEIDETWKRLLSDDVSFYKQLVFREGEEELGTASAVQVYEHTWLFQHLAASSHPVKLIPKHIMIGLMQFFMENRDVKYLISYFRKENSFPRRIFLEFLERYPLEDQLSFKEYSFLSLDLAEQKRREERQSDSVRSGMVIEHASEADKQIIENYFQKSLSPLEFRARSLFRDELHLPETSAAFRSRGLKRERFCLVAKRGGALGAFSLLENSSSGINLSGLLDTFSIHTIHPDAEQVGDFRRCLLDAVLDCYRSWHTPVAICLTEEDDLGDYFCVGFKKEKEYACLTWSRRSYKRYHAYLRERFGRFDERFEIAETDDSHGVFQS